LDAENERALFDKLQKRRGALDLTAAAEMIKKNRFGSKIEHFLD